MTVERKDQAQQQMESLSLRLTQYSKHWKIRKFPYRNPRLCTVSQNLSETFLGMKSCNIFLLLFGVFQWERNQISPVHLQLSFGEVYSRQVHRMKNLTRRDGRIQGIHEKRISPAESVSGGRTAT